MRLKNLNNYRRTIIVFLLTLSIALVVWFTTRDLSILGIVTLVFSLINTLTRSADKKRSEIAKKSKKSQTSG